jgi:hypothetical protein
MRSSVRIPGFVLVGVLAVGIGFAFAQEKPPAGQDKEKKESVAVVDPVSGAWDGSVETQNGPIAFGLTIKLEKDKLSGEIASQEGTVPISGTWAEGKLSVTFDYNGGPVAMSGQLKEGALSGDMSFAGGQSVLPWSAKKHAG